MTTLPDGTLSEALSISTVLVDIVAVAELDCDALDDVESVEPRELWRVELGVDDGPGFVELDESVVELAVALAPT